MTMSQAEDLAKKFEDANAMVIASIEACGEAEWGATSGEEGWPAAVLAHHIAGGGASRDLGDSGRCRGRGL